jgi:hypothetical protein
MDLPGWKLHSLKGKLKGFWSVWVSGNWRIVFRFKGSRYRVSHSDPYWFANGVQRANTGSSQTSNRFRLAVIRKMSRSRSDPLMDLRATTPSSSPRCLRRGGRLQEVQKNMPTRIAAMQPHCSSVIRSRSTSAAKASVTSG